MWADSGSGAGAFPREIVGRVGASFRGALLVSGPRRRAAPFKECPWGYGGKLVQGQAPDVHGCSPLSAGSSGVNIWVEG
jgi:hypothetical protein